MSNENSIAVFDFDGTLYRKDTLIAFCLFVYKKHPWRMRFFPLQCVAAALYFFKLIPILTFKSLFIRFTSGWNTDELKKQIAAFWSDQKTVDFHDNILQALKDYQSNNIPCVCISASPQLFIQPICDQWGIEVLGSEIAQHNNTWVFVFNCRGKNKVMALHEKHPNAQVEVVFSDNNDDDHLFAIAQKSFWVKNGDPVPFIAP
jgi:phosphatidylglycerophosphatase C